MFWVKWATDEGSDCRQLAEAKRYLDRGEVARSLVLLERLAARGSGRGEAAYLLGVCEQRMGDLDAALDAWRRVPPESSHAAPALTRRAAVALERGAFDLGERILRDALERRGPHEAEAREMLGRLLRFQDRRSEARSLLRRRLARAPDPVRVVRDLWMLDAEDVPIERTRTMFEEALRANPGDDRVRLGLANLSLRAGRLDEAARGLDQCLRARPDDVPTWRARLSWALVAGDTGEARRALGHLPPDRLDPGELLELEAWFAARSPDLAELAVEAGEPELAADVRRRKAEADRARDRYARLLRLEDDALAPRAREMARLAKGLGRRDEATGWWLAVIRREPGALGAREALARLEMMSPP